MMDEAMVVMQGFNSISGPVVGGTDLVAGVGWEPNSSAPGPMHLSIFLSTSPPHGSAAQHCKNTNNQGESRGLESYWQLMVNLSAF
jgi:hypothetical protein